MSAAAPTIDLEVFEGLREEFGNEVLVSLAGLFCERAPLVNKVVLASRGDDRRKLKKLAHELRGAASILAATRLAELCRELEEAARKADPEEWEPVAAAVAAEYVRAVAHMSDVLAASPPRRRAPRPAPRSPAAGSA